MQKSAKLGLGLTPVQHRQMLGNPEVSGSNPLPATKKPPERWFIVITLQKSLRNETGTNCIMVAGSNRTPATFHQP